MSAPVSDKGTVENDRGVVWFISFGDLLTLLVCFFLVLTPWEKLGAPRNPLIQAGVGTSGGERRNNGIPIAASAIKHGYGQTSDTPDNGLVSEIPLWRNDLEAGTGEALREEVEAIEEVTGLRVTIRLCERRGDRETALRQVVSALGGSKIASAPVVVQSEGAQCDEVRVLRPVTGEILGTVRLERV